ncbi:argininosuccinate lyase [Dehalococcoidia bacterium]|nr:argininosuccinate lyase [Dehalococcoidia bacterium]
MGLKEVSSAFTVSLHYDRRLYRQDIDGSIAHARMLANQRIINQTDCDAIVDGLKQILVEIEANEFKWRTELEDLHMNVECRLYELIGEPALRLHTARSRNDQVALDMRMYVKEAIDDTLSALHRLRNSLVSVAAKYADVVMPGYTHVQRAQPVLFAHHMLVYFNMFSRDAERLRQAKQRTDVMPLGSGALAGVPYTIDREFVAKELGFSRVSTNSMDAVSDRDFLLDFHAAASISVVHLSRISEELVLWSSAEFDFVTLSDEHTTGSSMMPQKRNPDFAEIARGKTGRVFGNLVGLLTTMKGLPLTYNRDLQEDKEGFFDTADTLLATIDVCADMLDGIIVNGDRMREAASSGYALATDIADYLVGKGVPFRAAYRIVAELSDHAVESGRRFDELSLEEFQRFSNRFDDGVFDITVDTSIAARAVPGGTSPDRVAEAIVAAQRSLQDEING